MNPPEILVDFSAEDRTEWRAVNDGVMGGLSVSTLRRTDDGTGIFSGDLSLQNNGGFASARAMLGLRDLSAFAGLEIRVRGDGRTYQLRLRTDDRFDGVAYRAEFETRDREWLTVNILFKRFLPTYRGRILTDVPALDTGRIRQLSIMLADKNAGPFSLEVDHISTGSPEVGGK